MYGEKTGDFGQGESETGCGNHCRQGPGSMIRVGEQEVIGRGKLKLKNDTR